MNPQFVIHSGAMVPFTRDVNGVTRKFLKTTASSTVKDLHGDEIVAEAVKKMAQTAKDSGMTIFLNHEYQVPEDLFGSTTDAAAVQRGFDSKGNAIWDMDLELALNEANPRAVQAYDAYMTQGVKMGVSIGAQILDWEPIDQKAGVFGGLRIKDVTLLEASIVGIPANPRSWVERAIKSIRAVKKAEDDGSAETMTMIMNGSMLAKKESAPDADLADLLGVPQDADGDTPAPEETETADEAATEGNDSVDQLGPDAESDDTSEVTLAAAGCPTCGGSKGSPKGGCASDFHKAVEPTTTASESPEVTAEASTDPDATDGATQDASSAASVALAATSIDTLVKGYVGLIADKDAQISQLTKERDEAREGLAVAKQIVDTIASLPLGRKTSFQAQVTTFRRDLAGVYGKEFMDLLERNPEA